VNVSAIVVQAINVLGRDEQLGGAFIHCIGIEGCANTKISGLNVKSIDGAKIGSLRNAQISLVNPTSDFSLDCIGPESCMNAKIEIKVAGPPPGFMCNPAIPTTTIEYAAISCYGENACNGMEIIIDNQGCNPIELQQLECYHPTACVASTWDFRGVTVNNCDLIGATGAVANGLTELCPNAGQGAAPQQPLPQYPIWTPLV